MDEICIDFEFRIFVYFDVSLVLGFIFSLSSYGFFEVVNSSFFKIDVVDEDENFNEIFFFG